MKFVEVDQEWVATRVDAIKVVLYDHELQPVNDGVVKETRTWTFLDYIGVLKYYSVLILKN